MASEVSERIHGRISFQKWQGQFENLQTVSLTPVKENWFIDAQEIKDDGGIGRTG